METQWQRVRDREQGMGVCTRSQAWGATPGSPGGEEVVRCGFPATPPWQLGFHLFCSMLSPSTHGASPR